MSFPTVSLLDSFERANETPLDNGGKWGEINDNFSGNYRGGIRHEAYTPIVFAITSAYWVAHEFTEGGVCFTLAANGTPQLFDRLDLWYAQRKSNANAFKGWRLEVEVENWAKEELKLVLFEYDALGEPHQVKTKSKVILKSGDKVGLSIDTGKVRAWIKSGAGAWTEQFNNAVGTFTKGYVGIMGEFSEERFLAKKFEAGPSPPVALENPGSQGGNVGKSVSLQIKGSEAVNYKATKLPAGLSINESTGLITGTPTTVETSLVKVTAEGEGKDTVEVSFEWNIKAELPKDRLDMILS